jgi:outer membrane protein
VKKYIIFLFAVVIGSPLLFGQTKQKIGYVDSQVILNQLPEAIKAQGDLDALTNKWSAQLDSMTSDYQNNLANYQKQSTTMTAAKKADVEKQLINEQNNILDFKKEKFAQGTGDIYKEQDKIFTPVKNKIYAAIKDVAKKEDMQFIFDKSGDIVLLYADPQYDITYKVLDLLKTQSGGSN